MTDQELKKLNRNDLLELLLEQKKENERLKEQAEKLRQDADRLREQLSDRSIRLEKAGSIAEASLQLNNVFEAAEAACAQYIDNIKLLNTRQESNCVRMEQETRKKCDDMIAEAKQKSQQYWDEASLKIKKLYDSYSDLRGLLTSLPELKA